VVNIESVMIRASAGSGKTWQLANRYLALLVLGVKPERIIALTFTKKAAGEFSERILTRLAEGAEDEARAVRLSGEIESVIHGAGGMPRMVDLDNQLPDMDAAFFRDLLKNLVMSMDQLALSTLDSFFVKLLRNFAFELGMSGFELLEGMDLEIEKARVFAEIFDASSGQGQLSKSMQGFVQAFRQTSAGDEAIRVSQRLKNFINEYQQRWLQNPSAESWGNVGQMWKAGFMWMSGGGYAEKAKLVLDLLDENPFSSRGYTNALIKVAEILGEREGKVGTPIVANARLSFLLDHLGDLISGSLSDSYYKKEQVISGELAGAFYDLLSTFVGDEILAKLERTQGVYKVIKAYEQRYGARVRGQGKLAFADATLLLSGNESVGLWDEVSKDLVEFRFDGKYDHWLLDEFQDTSVAQWAVIQNLIDEVVNDVEGERSLFVVGDSKQGIYGWRGGEPKLFDELAVRYAGRLSEYPMDQSWRSADSVLALVNRICSRQSRGMSLFPKQARERWKFHQHVAANESLHGHSWVCEMGEIEDLSSDEVRMGWIGELIKMLDPVRRGLSCAVLVRKNSRGREIAEYLREYHSETPVAVEDELLVGEENPVTSVLVDAFRFLCYPTDSLAWWHVQMTPFGEIFSCGESGSMRKQWYFWTREISVRGVEHVLDVWCSALEEKVDLSEYSLGRIQELRHAAAEYSKKSGGLTDWLTEVEAWKQREVTREGVVQIMTVHKAKGLGFDAVILPDLDNSVFDDEGRLKVMESERSDSPEKHLMMMPVKVIRDADEVLSNERDRWAVEQCYEQFCVLYVMLTRAVHGTYCLLDGKKNKPDKRKRNEADWIRESVSGCAERDEELGEFSGRVLFEHGGWSWLDKIPVEEREEEGVEKQVILPVASVRDSGVVAGDAKVQRYAQRLMDQGGVKFGNKVHQCFETIEWWEGNLEWQGDAQVRELVLECLKHPSILPFFTPREGLKVYREQPMEVMLECVWVSGVLDRLLVEMDENGKVIYAAIMDFKTDQVEAESELIERYSDQLDRYVNMVAEAYALPDENVYAVILSTHFRKIINL